MKRTALAVLILASIASAAMAQSAPQSSVTQPIGGPPPKILSAPMSVNSLMWLHNLPQTSGLEVTPAQWRRANQAAKLINANQCDEAYKLAVAANDERLATNITRTCATPQRP